MSEETTSAIEWLDADDMPIDVNAHAYDDADEGVIDGIPVLSVYGSETRG